MYTYTLPAQSATTARSSNATDQRPQVADYLPINLHSSAATRPESPRFTGAVTTPFPGLFVAANDPTATMMPHSAAPANHPFLRPTPVCQSCLYHHGPDACDGRHVCNRCRGEDPPFTCVYTVCMFADDCCDEHCLNFHPRQRVYLGGEGTFEDEEVGEIDWDAVLNVNGDGEVGTGDDVDDGGGGS